MNHPIVRSGPGGFLVRCFLALAAALLLAACQTTPNKYGLSAKQIAALERMGFVEMEDGWGRSLNGSILFKSDTDQISNEASAIIERVVDTLQSIGIDAVRVEGHTDNTGTPDYNMALAERRAGAVARELARHGLPHDNIVRRSFGSMRPIADNATADGRAQNRRVAIIVPAM
ncbi:OmpA family protein [Thauera sp. Sel9]|uniref:OmpA family protein n=1 Tax=Thauera sp. Sel9 TaxID=2974299 RepID=UPI0021E130DF|nr:OmpA family protein [Thauera sp. Sel9]MCV2219886.1 OmpA family protein [Thauera sp. Sel9]